MENLESNSQELDELSAAQSKILKKIRAIKYEPAESKPLKEGEIRATRHSETQQGHDTLRKLTQPNFMPAKGTTFEDLGKYLTGDGSIKVQNYLMKLSEMGRDDDYFEAYMKLLQYFRPKVMAHAVKTQTEVIFRFDQDDQDLVEGI